MRNRLLICLATAAALVPHSASAAPRCAVSASWTADAPILHTARKLAQGRPVTIVALGSSSTAGAGASGPAASYPSRLQALLRASFGNDRIEVVNRGVNGEEVQDMLARFETDVVAAKPDLVLWQIGTNAIIRDVPPEQEDHPLREGLRLLKIMQTDVIVMDPQYVPKILAKPDHEAMVDAIAAAAHANGAGLFRRFALMRQWRDDAKIAFADFTTPDELHMSDWGYECLARNIAASLGRAAEISRAPAVASSAPPAIP